MFHYIPKHGGIIDITCTTHTKNIFEELQLLRNAVATASRVWYILIKPRENDGTEREAQGVGRDMSCPRKVFLT